jgi:hypothetical protein
VSESRVTALSAHILQAGREGKHNRWGDRGCSKRCTAGRDHTIKGAGSADILPLEGSSITLFNN